MTDPICSGWIAAMVSPSMKQDPGVKLVSKTVFAGAGGVGRKE